MHDGGKPRADQRQPELAGKHAMLAIALTHAVRMVEEGSFDIYA
jgi:hypothetical protein